VAGDPRGRLRDRADDLCSRLSEGSVHDVKGVGDVFLGGYVEPNLRVWLDSKKMHEREITVDDVVNAIRDQHAEIPAGYIDTGKQDLNVRVMGEARTVKDFENIIIGKRQNAGMIWRRFRLKDIGRIEDALNDVRRMTRNNGESAVGSAS